jgi:hypothetical protein
LTNPSTVILIAFCDQYKSAKLLSRQWNQMVLFYSAVRVRANEESQNRGRIMPKQFIVDVSDAKLSPQVARELETAVQRAALSVLARLDLASEVNVRIPKKEWLGIWIEGRLPGTPERGGFFNF